MATEIDSQLLNLKQEVLGLFEICDSNEILYQKLIQKEKLLNENLENLSKCPPELHMKETQLNERERELLSREIECE